MRIGVVETGRPPPELAARYGDYPEMFHELLMLAEPDIECHTIAVLDGELPGVADRYDGWLITGSVHAVYEDHGWIEPLEQLCRDCAQGARALVGICFGHQLIAQALGGTVRKSERGWGTGVHTYRVDAKRGWMREPRERISSVVSHQDQIVTLPDGAEVLASSAFCPYALMTVGDHVMSMQCHPEMSIDFSRDLIEVRRERLGRETANAALESLSTQIDRELLASWIVAFLKGLR